VPRCSKTAAAHGGVGALLQSPPVRGRERHNVVTIGVSARPLTELAPARGRRPQRASTGKRDEHHPYIEYCTSLAALLTGIVPDAANRSLVWLKSGNNPTPHAPDLRTPPKTCYALLKGRHSNA
jgi:hypothetical protein